MCFQTATTVCVERVCRLSVPGASSVEEQTYALPDSNFTKGGKFGAHCNPLRLSSRRGLGVREYEKILRYAKRRGYSFVKAAHPDNFYLAYAFP